MGHSAFSNDGEDISAVAVSEGEGQQTCDRKFDPIAFLIHVTYSDRRGLVNNYFNVGQGRPLQYDDNFDLDLDDGNRSAQVCIQITI